ncbi:hypothetical protein DFH09DRAFT_1381954 [Mycena vulgaris]|nr:hypothetical protein DFH09DRAFT_1381954 [Mycena vulgaris]
MRTMADLTHCCPLILPPGQASVIKRHRPTPAPSRLIASLLPPHPLPARTHTALRLLANLPAAHHPLTSLYPPHPTPSHPMDSFTDIFATVAAASDETIDVPLDEDTKAGYGSGFCVIA